MKCSEAQRRMSDHMDGLLSKSEVQGLERHMHECMDCANLFVEMKSLVHEARNLNTFEPSDDVWLSVKRHMTGKDPKEMSPQKKKRQIFRLFSFPQGVAVASGVLIMIMLFTFLFFHDLPFVNTEPKDSAEYASEHFEKAEKHYQLAINALVRTMPDYRAKLPPHLAVVFKENLAIIDNSIRICQAAIEAHPADKAANALLMACYKKKIELLNDIRDLSMRAG